MPSFPLLTIPEVQDKDGELREIGQFIIRTRPLGFRGIKYLTRLLHLFPYVTGSVPKFKLTIRHKSTIEDIAFRVAIFAVRDDETYKTLWIDKSDTEDYVAEIEAPMIPQTGQYRYSANLESRVNAQCNCDIVVFRALAQESITLWLGGMLTTLLGVGIGGLLTWLLTK